MTITLGLPQTIYLALACLAVILAIVKHGQPKDPYNAYITFADTVITCGLLAWGGFFG